MTLLLLKDKNLELLRNDLVTKQAHLFDTALVSKQCISILVLKFASVAIIFMYHGRPSSRIDHNRCWFGFGTLEFIVLQHIRFGNHMWKLPFFPSSPKYWPVPEISADLGYVCQEVLHLTESLWIPHISTFLPSVLCHICQCARHLYSQWHWPRTKESPHSGQFCSVCWQFNSVLRPDWKHQH